MIFIKGFLILSSRYFDSFLPENLKAEKNPLKFWKFKQYSKDKQKIGEYLSQVNQLDEELQGYMFSISKI